MLDILSKQEQAGYINELLHRRCTGTISFVDTRDNASGSAAAFDTDRISDDGASASDEPHPASDNADAILGAVTQSVPDADPTSGAVAQPEPDANAILGAVTQPEPDANAISDGFTQPAPDAASPSTRTSQLAYDGIAGFANGPIDADGLPHLHEQPFAPLDPAYARVRAMSAVLLATAIALASVIGSFVLSSWIPLVAGGALVMFVVAIGIAQRLETDHMGYLVRDHDVSFCSGVIGRSVATVPFARVQHVSIERGPIDRRFGLAALQLRTAGGHIAIPGLRLDIAERLKQLVADRSAALAQAEIDDESPVDPDAA